LFFEILNSFRALPSEALAKEGGKGIGNTVPLKIKETNFQLAEINDRTRMKIYPKRQNFIRGIGIKK
jgi:hypothetical protein